MTKIGVNGIVNSIIGFEIAKRILYKTLLSHKQADVFNLAQYSIEEMQLIFFI